jgi:uncharacterized protein YcfJ
MNFRELINKLDHINEAEGLTLQSIAAIEQAAMAKAGTEKAKGGWTGFTTWDPRVAGNIALAKLAQQNNFEGLFNSEGDFVVAYGNRTWSSNSEMHPGENPRVVPPSPDDWKPLAAKGLVPQNAKGPAGLTNWLSSGGAQKEFDAVKKQSADVAANAAAPVDAAASMSSPAQAASVSTVDEETMMTQLEDLVEQYLTLKTTSKKVAVPAKNANGKTAKANSDTTDGVDDSNKSAPGETALKTAGGATAGYLLGNKPKAGPKGKLRPSLGGVIGGLAGGYVGSQLEENIATSLVESFGYQKKPSIEEIVESLGLRKDYPYGHQFLKEASNTASNKDELEIPDDEDLSGELEIPDSEKVEKVEKEVRNKVFGTGGSGSQAIQGIGKTLSGNNKKSVSKDPQSLFDMAFHNKYWNNWTEDSLSWDDEIIPGFDWMDGEPLYTFRDLGLDLGIAAGFVMVGTILAPFTAGASVPVAAAAGVTAGVARAGGTLLIRLLIKIAIAIIKAVKLYGKPFWELAKLNLVKAIKAVGQIAKTHLEAFYNGIAKAFSLKPMLQMVFYTSGFNALLVAWEKWSGKYLPGWMKKPIDDLASGAADLARRTFNGARKVTGLEEGLA